MRFHLMFAWRKWPALVVATVIALIGLCDLVSSQQPSFGREMLEAAGRGDVTALKRLIAAGAPLDAIDEAKRTPLLIAVEKNQLETAMLLIEAGAISMRKRQIWTRLGYWPARLGELRCFAP